MYREMWEYMVRMKREKGVELIVDSNEEGFKRANEENYAYIGESLTLEYAATRPENANLTTYGGLLNSVGFGVALKKSSPYLDELSLAILGEKISMAREQPLQASNIPLVDLVFTLNKHDQLCAFTQKWEKLVR